MREQLRQQLRGMLSTLGDAERILDSSCKKKDEEAVSRLLEDMQDSAVAIGTTIEKEEGEGSATVKALEDYCELLYQYLVADKSKARFQIGRQLAGKRGEALSSLEKEFEGYLEVGFLICREKNFERMRGIYDRAAANPAYRCSLLTSPYYDCPEDGGEDVCHDESELFPSELGGLDYRTYNLAAMKPDIVFIDGPFVGQGEAGTSPDYDIERLRDDIGLIVYMPFYEEGSQVEEADCLNPQVRFSDVVVVQSEEIKRFYLGAVKKAPEGRVLAMKIVAAGDVNLEKLMRMH